MYILHLALKTNQLHNIQYQWRSYDHFSPNHQHRARCGLLRVLVTPVTLQK